jgi:dUTPase
LPKKTTCVPTGLKVSVPAGYEVRIEPITGLPVTIAAGAPQTRKGIASEKAISITVTNIGLDILAIKEGNRIAKGALRPPRTHKPAQPE